MDSFDFSLFWLFFRYVLSASQSLSFFVLRGETVVRTQAVSSPATQRSSFFVRLTEPQPCSSPSPYRRTGIIASLWLLLFLLPPPSTSTPSSSKVLPAVTFLKPRSRSSNASSQRLAEEGVVVIGRDQHHVVFFYRPNGGVPVGEAEISRGRHGHLLAVVWRHPRVL